MGQFVSDAYKPVLLFDDTVFGSSKLGFILTDKALHYHLHKSHSDQSKVKGLVSASEIISVRFEKAKLDSADIFVNDTMIGNATALGKRQRSFLTDLFRDLLAGDIALSEDLDLPDHLASPPEIPVSSQATSQAKEGPDGGLSGIVGAALVAAFLYFGTPLFTNVVSTQEAPVVQQAAPVDPADEACKRLIEGRLRAPNSVRYESKQKSGLFGNDETWIYILRAQNGFGGMNREQWVCTVHKGERSAFPM